MHLPVRRRRIVAESVATSTAPPLTPVREATRQAARVTGPGRMLIRLIRPGWSLNDVHWSEEVLRRDGPSAWPQGTQCLVDHPTDEQEEARPPGSIRDLGAVLTTDARWDDSEQALVAEIRLFHPWADTLVDMADTIGMSIRAWVTGEEGEVDGRTGFVVTSIPQGRSVDFVTQPAAGGGIISVLESVGHRVPVAEARTLGGWLESRLHLRLTELGDEMYGDGRLTRAERITLSTAIGEALQAWTARVEADAPQLFRRDLYDEPGENVAPASEASGRGVAEAPAGDTRAALVAAVRAAHEISGERYPWVVDFDPQRSLVWFEINDTCWQQSYAVRDDSTVGLVGEPVEVVRRTVYQPIGSPAGDTAEAVAVTTGDTTSVTAVAEHDTDGVPPAVPPASVEEEPAMSRETTGTPAADVGGAPSPTPPTPPAPAVGVSESTIRSLVEAVTAPLHDQLRQMGEAFASLTERHNQEEADRRRRRNQDRAGELLTTALAAREHEDVAARISKRVRSRVLAALPTTDEGFLDETRLGEEIAEAIADEAEHVRTLRAEALEEAGVGRPYGIGASQFDDEPDDGDDDRAFENHMSTFFEESLGMTDTQAAIAAKGR